MGIILDDYNKDRLPVVKEAYIPCRESLGIQEPNFVMKRSGYWRRQTTKGFGHGEVA